MDSDVEFVKEQIANQEKMAAKYADQPHRAGLHLASAARFRVLATRLSRLVDNHSSEENNRVNISLSDLEGLPEDVMAELSISDSDRQEMIIEDIIAKNTGVISLDKLIVNYYRREREVLKRSTLVSRLYRMGEKGMIFNVPGKRGYYSTCEMSEEDVRKVFGQPDNPMDVVDGASAAAEDMTIGESFGNMRVRRRRRVYSDPSSSVAS